MNKELLEELTKNLPVPSYVNSSIYNYTERIGLVLLNSKDIGKAVSFIIFNYPELEIEEVIKKTLSSTIYFKGY